MFDIDALLATDPVSTAWLVRQNKSALEVGDKVYVWRNIGGGDKKKAGLVAEARIAGPVQQQAVAPEELVFWTDPADAQVENRVEIVFEKIYARPRLQWAWVESDPVIGRFKQVQGTNIAMSSNEAERMRILAERVSEDWTYAEAVAGLWAYAMTRDIQVSKLSGSPVADAALRSGRVVTGMYNKVMNFRAIDPNDSRKGLSAASGMDRDIWAKFYSNAIGDLDVLAIEVEYRRLWPSESGIESQGPKPEPPPPGTNLAELLSRWQKRKQKEGGGDGPPRSYSSKTRRFEREELVYQIALLRANGACEVPGCYHPLFETSDNLTFLEVHHIEFLSEGGKDSPENTAAICPAHHREAHFGVHAGKIASQLAKVRQTDPT